MQSYYYSSATKNPLTGPLGGGSFAGRATSGPVPRADSSDTFTTTMVENKLMMPHPTRRGFFNFGDEMKSFTEAPANRLRAHPMAAVPSVNIDLRVKVAKVSLQGGGGRPEERRSGSREGERKTAILLASHAAGGRNSHLVSAAPKAFGKLAFLGWRCTASICERNALSISPFSARLSRQSTKRTAARRGSVRENSKQRMIRHACRADSGAGHRPSGES